LGSLVSLEVADFDGDPHSDQPVIQGGTLPPELGNLTNLTTLGVTGPVTGIIPISYTAWTKLKAFRVAGTSLTGTIPPQLLAAWPGLRALSIDGALLSGPVPGSLFNCTLLEEVVVQRTPVSGPAWFLDVRASGLTHVSILGFGE
jgi:hypothetical protein